MLTNSELNQDSALKNLCTKFNLNLSRCLDAATVTDTHAHHTQLNIFFCHPLVKGYSFAFLKELIVILSYT